MDLHASLLSFVGLLSTKLRQAYICYRAGQFPVFEHALDTQILMPMTACRFSAVLVFASSEVVALC